MRILLFISLVVLFGSCNRTEVNHKVRFRGTAVDFDTRYPVKNAIIQIREEYEHPNGRQDQSIINGGSTDENGFFDFKVKGVHKDRYVTSRHFVFIGPAVSSAYESGVFPISETDNTNETDVTLHTMSRLHFFILNSTPYNSLDEISGIYIERPWGQQYIGSSDLRLVGTNVNQEIWSSYYGYTTHILHYSVAKNGNYQSYTDTIYTPDPFSDSWIDYTLAY